MGVRDTVSIIVPTPAIDRVPPLPPGADEALLVGGNDGQAHAKNVGASKASGSILVFLDDDVRVEGSLECLRRAPSDERWWSATYRDGTGDPYTQRMVAAVNVAARLGMHIASIGPFLALRRELFERVGGFGEEELHEDTGAARRLGEAGARLSLLPLTVTLYRPFTPFRGTWAKAGRWRGRPKSAEPPFRRLVPATAPAGGTLGTR